jgi:hypothetical protein
MKKQLESSRIVAMALALAAQPAFAQGQRIESGLQNLTTSITSIVTGVLFAVAAIFWGLVGYKFISNAPDAKQSLTNAIIGTVLLVIGGGVVAFIRDFF